MKNSCGEDGLYDVNPNRFQTAAMERLSSLLRSNSIDHTVFRHNYGSFWTSFTLDGREHTLAVYPSDLNIAAGNEVLYECYLQEEYESPDALLDSFAQRLERLLRERIWTLPQEDCRSSEPRRKR